MMNMMLGKTVVWMVVAGALFSGMASAQDFEGLRDAMTPEELEAAGLDSLSPSSSSFWMGGYASDSRRRLVQGRWVKRPLMISIPGVGMMVAGRLLLAITEQSMQRLLATTP